MIDEDFWNTPDRWEVRTIAEVIDESKNGGTPKKSEDSYWEGDIGWLNSGDVRGKYTSEPSKFITERALDNTSAKLFEPGSVLVAMYGGKGTIGRATILENRLSGNQAICALLPDKEVVSEEYLYYYFNHIRNRLEHLARGGSQSNINQSIILNQKIPVPPLEEQERIVAELEERLSVVDALTESVSQVGDLTSEYKDSLLAYLFAGKGLKSSEAVATLPTENSLPKDWTVEELGDVAHFQNGNNFSKSQWEEEGKPIIRIQNLTGTGDEYNYYSGTVHERYRVENNDILFSWSGTIDAFRWEGSEAWLNQHIYRVDTEDSVRDDYIYQLLKRVASILEKKKVGGTLQHIRKGDITSLKIPLPPKGKQKDIVDEIEAVDMKQIQRSVKNVNNLFDEYRDAVLAEAFTGKL